MSKRAGISLMVQRRVTISPPRLTQRVRAVMSMFGLDARGERAAAGAGAGADANDRIRERTIIPNTEITLPIPGPGIVLITGPSGAGKSTLLRLIAAELAQRRVAIAPASAWQRGEVHAPAAAATRPDRMYPFIVINRYMQRGSQDLAEHPDPSPPLVLVRTAAACDANEADGLSAPASPDACVIDLIAPQGSLPEALHALSIAGLSDAFVMLRRPAELSDGQRARLEIARTLSDAAHQGDDGAAAVVMLDEFAATLDRVTATTLARSLRRWSDRSGATFILATSHDDLIDALTPDVLIVTSLAGDLNVIESEHWRAARGANRSEVRPAQRASHQVGKEQPADQGQPAGQQQDCDRDAQQNPRPLAGATHRLDLAGNRGRSAGAELIEIQRHQPILADHAARGQAHAGGILNHHACDHAGDQAGDHALIEPGTLADYRALAAFHYRGHHAGAVTAVWRLIVPTSRPLGATASPSITSATATTAPLPPDAGESLTTHGHEHAHEHAHWHERGHGHRSEPEPESEPESESESASASEREHGTRARAMHAQSPPHERPKICLCKNISYGETALASSGSRRQVGGRVAGEVARELTGEIGDEATGALTGQPACELSGELAGVLVLSLPALSCSLRDLATGGRYAKLMPRERGIMLNREVRCISRVIIDPRFRGLGLAVRLVRHALAHAAPGVAYIEALAAMGRVNPFFQRAGMRRYDLPLHCRAAHARMLDALESLALSPDDLDAASHEWSALAEGERLWLRREARRFLQANRRMTNTALDALPDHALLTATRSRLGPPPVYYLHATGAPPTPPAPPAPCAPPEAHATSTDESEARECS